jgi:hypothetical protein
MRRARWVFGAAAALVFAAGLASASTVIGLSIEDQARLSRYVVVGRVIGQHGVEDPVNGIETEVTLAVKTVLKGDVRRGENLVFHTRSGEVGEESSQAIGEAELKSGQTVLVFLEDIDGRLYNLGLSMGVWDVVKDRSGKVQYTRALREGLVVVGDIRVENGPITAAAMRGRVNTAIQQPAFDHPMLRERAEREVAP